MSFLYPRTVNITRPAPPTGVGARGYGGVSAAQETAVASGLPANIQFAKMRGKTDAGVPADGEKTFWKVLLPKSAAANGLIQARDIVTDDLGQRYQVTAPYWNSLGYNLMAERLET